MKFVTIKGKSYVNYIIDEDDNIHLIKPFGNQSYTGYFLLRNNQYPYKVVKFLKISDD